MSSNGLLVIGSGPGISLSTASLFAQLTFDKIALVSRTKTSLARDAKKILAAAEAAGRNVQIKTWNVDVTDSAAYLAVLKEIEAFARLTCVIFNAARVEPSELLGVSGDYIVNDFMTTNIGLYNTAVWALPILSKLKPEDKPSLLVTSSLLWKQPFPMFFSLSMVKASQRNLVHSLAMTNPNVHIATLNVGGPVTPEDKHFNPPAIAEKFWELYSQEKHAWTLDLDLLGE